MKKKWLMFGLGGVGIVLLGIFVFFLTHQLTSSTTNSSSSVQQGDEAFDMKAFFESLPSCTTRNQFTVLPLPLDRFDGILPLGTIDPPTKHVLPVDHLYIGTTKDGLPTHVSAPGDLTIYQVTKSSRFDAQHKETFTDYGIYFGSCKEFKSSFGHIRTLSDALQQAIATAEQACDPEYQVLDFSVIACKYFPNFQIKAGELIGELSTKDGDPNFDFSATDLRNSPLAFASPDRYLGEQKYASCPLDLFAEAQKATLFGRLGGGQTRRTIEPRCGTIAQDAPGTLQGNWFDGEGEWGILEGQGKAIALIHDNNDPAIGVVSLGTGITSGSMRFTPQHTGTRNREFSEVTPSSTISCYESSIAHDERALLGKLLTQLVDATTLRVEYQEGRCSDAEIFVAPKQYIR